MFSNGCVQIVFCKKHIHIYIYILFTKISAILHLIFVAAVYIVALVWAKFYSYFNKYSTCKSIIDTESKLCTEVGISNSTNTISLKKWSKTLFSFAQLHWIHYVDHWVRSHFLYIAAAILTVRYSSITVHLSRIPTSQAVSWIQISHGLMIIQL